MELVRDQRVNKQVKKGCLALCVCFDGKVDKMHRSQFQAVQLLRFEILHTP